jgi:hypothetical protein
VNSGVGVAVAVTDENNSTRSSFAYNGVASVGNDPGWGQAGPTLYAPVIMKNFYTWYSQLVLFNPNSGSANVTITYRDQDGYAAPASHTIPSYGRLVTNHNGGAVNVLYSAVITSDRPLAGVVHQYSGNIYETYNLFSAGKETNHAPLIMNNYYGWNTSVNVQNLSASSTNITIRYYRPDGTNPVTKTDTIPAFQSRSYYSPSQGLPGDFTIGSAKISSDQPVAVVVNQSTPTRGLSYSGVLMGSDSIVIPELLNDGWWTSSVNVRNQSETYSTRATMTFNGISWSCDIPKKGFCSFHVPSLWPMGPPGMAVLTSKHLVTEENVVPIGVVVNHSVGSPGSGEDLARSYMGINR